MRHQLGAQSPKLDPNLSICSPSPRFARSLPQGRAEEGRREVGREREGWREAEQAGRLPAASLVLPGAGRGGEGRLVRPGSSRLAGWLADWVGILAWRLCCLDNSWLEKSDSRLSEMFQRATCGGGERWPRGC